MNGLKAFAVSFYSVAIFSYEKFFEIPSDITAFDWFPNDLQNEIYDSFDRNYQIDFKQIYFLHVVFWYLGS